MTDIVERLRGVYRVPITDGLGPVGGREPNNPIEFVRKFETPPIQREAADEIERLRTIADERLTLCNAYLTRADRAERERDEARALVGNETTLLGIITDIRERSGLGAKPMLDELAEEIGKIRRERDEARAALDNRRMCVNCGRYAPAGHNRSEALPECVGPEGLSACTFDLTPDEAWQHWRDEYYKARTNALEETAYVAREYYAAVLQQHGYIPADPVEAMTKAAQEIETAILGMLPPMNGTSK